MYLNKNSNKTFSFYIFLKTNYKICVGQVTNHTNELILKSKNTSPKLMTNITR